MIRALRKRIQLLLVNLFLMIHTRKKDFSFSQQEFENQDKSQLKNILIYSSTALGDFMMNSPAIHALRQTYPSAAITLICHKKMYDFLKGGRDWDDLISWDNKLTTLPALVKEIKKRGTPDLTVILHSHTPYDFLSAIMAGTKYVFVDNDKQDIPLVSKWATNRISKFVGHTIQRKLELIMPLLNEKPDNSMHLPFPVERTVSEADSQLRWIGFQMGASSFKKCWPVERFVTFANQLFAHDDVRVVLIGAPNEVPLQDEFLQKLDSRFHDRVKPLIGKTTLKGLIQEVKNMDLLVTSDTGPMHLAVAMRVPTVSMYVITSHYLYGPYQDPQLHKVVYKAYTTLDEIKYRSALEKVSCEEIMVHVKPFLQ